MYFGDAGALTLFFLFFFYRDQDAAIHAVRRIMPLDDRETAEYFQRIEDAVHATIFGVVFVAMLQGALAGAMFAVLRVPGAILWGVVMGMLAIIPYLGTFVIWGPTAAILALQGETVKAVVLVGWGLLAIGLIDNMLYPVMVGQRMQQHTAIAFVAILGGVALFGAMGVVLGPLIVATSLFLLDVWRDAPRMAATPSERDASAAPAAHKKASRARASVHANRLAWRASLLAANRNSQYGPIDGGRLARKSRGPRVV